MSHKPHKHAALIKAWADGSLIERRYKDTEGGWVSWQPTFSPTWSVREDVEFRVKPERKTPGQVYWEAAWPNSTTPYKDAYRGIKGREPYEQGAQAVIDAYKRGEFDE